MSKSITINSREYEIDVPEDMPLLWFIRDRLDLTGTKYGCGTGQCGSCTVHLDGQPVRACLLPVGSLAGQSVTTIEGLSDNGDHPLQIAWVEHDVPQCGYCQAGQIMNAAGLLANNPAPSDAEIDAAMQGNICRCGTYQRIRKAIHSVVGQASKEVQS